MSDDAQLSLLDELPDEVSADLPEASVPATMYGHKANIDNGHLLIESAAGDWLFLNKGGRTIHCCLPGWSTAVELTAGGEAIRADFPHHHPTSMYRVGKHRAGRDLYHDGRTWDQYPEAVSFIYASEELT